MRAVCVAACFLAASPSALAQRNPLARDRLEQVRGVIDAIYRMDYATAGARSRQMISVWPGDPAGYVYLARVYWQELVFETNALSLDRFTQPDFFSGTPRYKVALDPEAARRFRAASNDAIRRAAAYLSSHPKDPAALYLLGVAYQTEASFQISLNNAWLAAIRAGERSYQAHRELMALDSRYGDARLVTGTYNYVAGSLPWPVRWLALLLGHHGSAVRGREELERAASEGVLVADDARALLALIYSIEKRYDLAARKLEELAARYPENYLARLDLAGLEIRRGSPGAAVKICRELLERVDEGEMAVVRNHLAVAYRALRDFAQAETLLRLTAESGSASAQARALALLELGRTLDLAGRREEAKAEYRAVLKLQDFAGTHRQATAHLGRPYRAK